MSASTPSTAFPCPALHRTNIAQLGCISPQGLFFFLKVSELQQSVTNQMRTSFLSGNHVSCVIQPFYSKNTHFIFYLQDVELSSMYLKFQQKFFLGLNNYKCRLFSAYLSIVCNGFFMLLFCFLFIGELMLECHVVSCLKNKIKNNVGVFNGFIYLDFSFKLTSVLILFFF